MPSFAYYIVGTALSPRKALKRLLDDKRQVRHSALAVGFVGILYTVTSLALALAGAVPLAPIFLQISPENYYFCQMIFMLPCVFFLWLLLGALVKILGKR